MLPLWQRTRFGIGSISVLLLVGFSCWRSRRYFLSSNSTFRNTLSLPNRAAAPPVRTPPDIAPPAAALDVAPPSPVAAALDVAPPSPVAAALDVAPPSPVAAALDVAPSPPVRTSLDITPYVAVKDGGPFVLESVWLPFWYKGEVNGGERVESGVDDIATFNKAKKQFALALDKEERIAIENFFNGFRNGVVFEMGALDGVKMSVSRVFEALFDWRSILVEAMADNAKQLPTKRPKALSIHTAVCLEPRVIHFMKGSTRQGSGGEVGAVAELTNEPIFLRRHHSVMLKDGKMNWEAVANLPEQICVPLGPILRALSVKHINFMVLDCEGCELEALKSLDFEEVMFDVLVVETERYKGENKTDEVIDIVTKANSKHTYKVFHRQWGRNTWFVREGFVASPHPKYQLKK